MTNINVKITGTETFITAVKEKYTNEKGELSISKDNNYKYAIPGDWVRYEYNDTGNSIIYYEVPRGRFRSSESELSDLDEWSLLCEDFPNEPFLIHVFYGDGGGTYYWYDFANNNGVLAEIDFASASAYDDEDYDDEDYDDLFLADDDIPDVPFTVIENADEDEKNPFS